MRMELSKLQEHEKQFKLKQIRRNLNTAAMKFAIVLIFHTLILLSVYLGSFFSYTPTKD